jgi:Ca-activated chloride channel homolog
MKFMRLIIFHLPLKDHFSRSRGKKAEFVSPSHLGEGRDGGKRSLINDFIYKDPIYSFNIKLILIAVMLNFSLSLHGQGDRKYIRQGNGKYNGGKFPESEVLYRKALNDNKTSADAGFNLGDALYRQNKYEDAAKQFQGNAGVMPDVSKKSDSYYNLGNSLVKAEKYEEAIVAYKNSLKLVPGRNEAKYNLAYAQDQLKEQQNNKDQDKKEEPSEYAKKLKAEADKLVAAGKFAEAFNLMQDGIKKDKTVNYYSNFVQKTGKVASIDAKIK